MAATALAVVSGAAGWHTAHRLLAAVALPPLVGLLILAVMAMRRLLPASIAALAFFGAAALLTGRDLHIAMASLAFAATTVLAAQAFRGEPDRPAACATS